MWWLRVSDVYNYIYTLYQITIYFIPNYCYYYFGLTHVVPSPGVEASANPTGSVFAGSVLTLTCTITLDGGLSGILNDLSVTTVWRTEGGQEVSTGGNIMVSGAAFAVGTTYSSTLSFNTVHTDDAGDYTCTATVSPSSRTSVPSSTVINRVGSSDPPVTVFVNGKIRQGLSNQSIHVYIFIYYILYIKTLWHCQILFFINI